MGDLLVLHQVTHDFQGIRALDNINLTVSTGSIHGLIGPNGAGKTTVFNAITGVIRPKGMVTFDGQMIGHWPLWARSRAGIQRVFQVTQLYRSLTIRDHFRMTRNPTEWVDRLGLQAWLDKRPNELPFGIGRLVELAIALSSSCRLLLLDEPAAGLSDEERKRLLTILNDVRDRGHTIMVVEHDLQWTMKLVDRLTVLDRGHILCDGDPPSVASSDAVRAAYLGEGEVRA